MAYRFDPDLEFLSDLTDEELEPLVNILTKDEKGNPRITEELTYSDIYINYFPQHHKYWREIATEIQLFGGNTIASFLRGKRGILYREILINVAEKLKVNFNKNSSVERIENNLLIKIFEDLYDNIPKDKLQDLFPDIDLSLPYVKIIANTALVYQMSRIILTPTWYSTISTRFLVPPVSSNPILGSLGWIITIGWIANAIASPAYRVIIPIVIYIASLRLLHHYELKYKNM